MLRFYKISGPQRKKITKAFSAHPLVGLLNVAVSSFYLILSSWNFLISFHTIIWFFWDTILVRHYVGLVIGEPVIFGWNGMTNFQL